MTLVLHRFVFIALVRRGIVRRHLLIDNETLLLTRGQIREGCRNREFIIRFLFHSLFRRLNLVGRLEHLLGEVN